MKNNTVNDNWYEDKACPVCGRRFTVLHPSRWAYKKPKGNNYTFFCSWRCLREDEKKNTDKETVEMIKETAARPRRDKRETLEGLISAFENDSKAPVEFLKEIGYKNPEDAWHEMKTWSKAIAPDLYGMLVEHKLVKPRISRKQIVEKVNKLPEGPEVRIKRFDKSGTPEKVELVYDPSIKEEYERDMKAREERGRMIAAGLDRAAAAREQMIDGIEKLPVAAVYSRVMPDVTFKKIDGGMALVGLSITNPIMLSAYEWFKLTEEILLALRQLDATRPGRDQQEE